MPKKNHKHRNIIITAIVISVLVSFISDLLTPDIVLLAFLYGIDPSLLLKVGIILLVVGFFFCLYMAKRRKH